MVEKVRRQEGVGVNMDDDDNAVTAGRMMLDDHGTDRRTAVEAEASRNMMKGLLLCFYFYDDVAYRQCRLEGTRGCQ